MKLLFICFKARMADNSKPDGGGPRRLNSSNMRTGSTHTRSTLTEPKRTEPNRTCKAQPKPNRTVPNREGPTRTEPCNLFSLLCLPCPCFPGATVADRDKVHPDILRGMISGLKCCRIRPSLQPPAPLWHSPLLNSSRNHERRPQHHHSRRWHRRTSHSEYGADEFRFESLLIALH